MLILSLYCEDKLKGNLGSSRSKDILNPEIDDKDAWISVAKACAISLSVFLPVTVKDWGPTNVALVTVLFA